jgi:23S rRNA pseudouridine2605 synthase
MKNTRKAPTGPKKPARSSAGPSSANRRAGDSHPGNKRNSEPESNKKSPISAGRPKANSGSTTARTQRNNSKSKASGSKATQNKRLNNQNTSSSRLEGVRINKYLADAGISSRRSAEDLIREGAVKVNGSVVTDLSTRVFLEDLVTVHGEPVSDRRYLTYFLLNKPKNVITTASDELGRQTVLDIVRSKHRIFPVGRLDRNTTGALLITNDGELAHRLTHPSYQIPREYRVGLDKPVEIIDAKKISRGIELEDGPTAPCEVFLDPKDLTKVTLLITEGRNREVRRIFESLGYEVKRLDRKRFAGLSTSGIKRGEFRQLTKQEVRDLRAMVGLEKAF